ncbi:hypothetical protein SAY86_029018 [Trapa natans]|uniref:Uncharacterized protein n=1 Tax=Trapa natans TaxID=22666 RepID=A0AAN7M2E1_TRANT|nr:hypothetical protein SAY86_029018 [Trapa natans]
MTTMSQDDTSSLQRTVSLTRRRSFRSGSGRDDRGWTPLHIVARRGDLKQVKRLLDKGMDVNSPAWGPKAKGATPLHLAAEGGHLDVMDELLERGANIDARTKGAIGLVYMFSINVPDGGMKSGLTRKQDWAARAIQGGGGL